MIEKKIQTNVANAIVRVLKSGGQGILVSGNLILTAAHCIEWSPDRWPLYNESMIEEIETAKGKKLKVSPYAVEPVNDIAVIGTLEGQLGWQFFPESEAFEKFCDKTEPIPLCFRSFKFNQKFPVYIYTHKKTWIEGYAQQYSIDKYSPVISVETDKQIEGGTSGGPIINEQGKLIAVVSISSEAFGPSYNKQGKLIAYNVPVLGYKHEAIHPCPHMALPLWICKRIKEAEESS